MNFEFQTLEVEIIGLNSILQHNIQLADPTNEFARKMKAISGKRTKTDADLLALRELEIAGGVYWSDSTGVYIPCDWLETCIIDAARKRRLGKDVQAGVQVVEDRLALVYEGMDKVETFRDIVSNASLHFVRGVRVGKARVMRARPIFRGWSTKATIAFDPEAINRQTLIELLDVAGSRIGMGDWRPKFGRFNVEVS
jgi:hypothetical protein